MARTDFRILHAIDVWGRLTENWLTRLVLHNSPENSYVYTKNIAPGSVLDASLHYLYSKCHRIPNESKERIISIWNLYAKCGRLLELLGISEQLKFKIDIIHSHFSVMGWELMPLARYLKVPHCVSFYGYDYEKLPFIEPIWRSRYEKMFKTIDVFICEGAFGAEILKSKGCPPEKIRICHLGVDVKQIEFDDAMPTRCDGVKYIQVASLVEKKGHADAIEAFAKAYRHLPRGSSLTFVGNGTDAIKSDLKAMVERFELASHVHFIEKIEFSKLHDLLKGYHFFIHPSKYALDRDCEGGAPIVLLDAQACGLPVITTNHCDIPEEVINGQTGYITESSNTEELAKSIIMAANLQDDIYQEMRIAARTHVERNYSMEANEKAMSQIYSEFLQR